MSFATRNFANSDISDRRLYFITGVSNGMVGLLQRAITGGADIVQIRDKQLSDRELLPWLEKARSVTRDHGIPLVINDRPDLAELVDADYVHVGQDDVPVELARRIIRGVGQSTHTPAQVKNSKADYIGVGPIYATPTKQGREPVGLKLIRYAAEHASQPWFAIGGIDEKSVAAVVSAGATRIAVVRAIADSSNPEKVARVLRKRLEEA